jgi:hypothetical protein
MAYLSDSLSEKSTNVRLESPLDPWPLRDVPPQRAPLWALGIWTAFVAGAGIEGVFARIEGEPFVALVIFTWAFVLAAARLDREVVAALGELTYPLREALLIDAGIAALIVAAGGAWATLPGALVLLVGIPLAAVLHAEAARRPRVRKAPGRSPGATRAAL